MSTVEPLIRLANVSKTFGEVRSLRKINFEIGQNEKSSPATTSPIRVANFTGKASGSIGWTSSARANSVFRRSTRSVRSPISNRRGAPS
jgi:hypothetical protein